jgi:hypothetical protein
MGQAGRIWNFHTWIFRPTTNLPIAVKDLQCVYQMNDKIGTAVFIMMTLYFYSPEYNLGKIQPFVTSDPQLERPGRTPLEFPHEKLPMQP